MNEGLQLCYSDLLGQAKAKKILSRVLTGRRIPHAFMFRGPDGVGKSLFARGVAAAVNCRGSNTGRACGSCFSCRKFFSGNHPDFQLVSPEKVGIKIDTIREVCRGLSYPPFESTYRVVILEDVHAMRREAANSLLKSLEEPPAGNILILTADGSQHVLPTLLSRCQLVPFAPLSTEETSIILKKNGIDDPTASLLASHADGSPGRGLLYHKTGMVELFSELIDFLINNESHPDTIVASQLLLANKIAALKEQMDEFFNLLRSWIRGMLLMEKAESPTDGGSRGVRNWSSSELFAKLEAIDKAEMAFKRNCNKSLVSEVLLFRLQSSTPQAKIEVRG